MEALGLIGKDVTHLKFLFTGLLMLGLLTTMALSFMPTGAWYIPGGAISCVLAVLAWVKAQDDKASQSSCACYS